jgi:DNA (cytosine-5)-methyltransferase 1
MINQRLGFYEFFAGGGMARLGLGREWRCLMANDICRKKGQAYRANFPPANEFILEDIHNLTLAKLPDKPILAWASFPCQDLSLAGNRTGLDAERSGTFWPFWRRMEAMSEDGRGLPIIVLENVVGAITSNNGRDIQAILDAMVAAKYRVGLLVIDAVHFLPQSRPRLFFIAIKRNQKIPTELIQPGPSDLWHPKALRAAYAALPDQQKNAWIWWRLPAPQVILPNLEVLIEDDPVGVRWHTPAETQYLLDLMSTVNVQKVRKAQALGRRIIGTVYKRTRRGEQGKSIQRAEVRFDQISGCLRTSIGGSSRQTILVIEGESIKSRLLSPREAARLMGVPDSYILPDNYNEAYHLMGDGLAVPVVEWIARHILAPLALANRCLLEAA